MARTEASEGRSEDARRKPSPHGCSGRLQPRHPKAVAPHWTFKRGVANGGWIGLLSFQWWLAHAGLLALMGAIGPMRLASPTGQLLRCCTTWRRVWSSGAAALHEMEAAALAVVGELGLKAVQPRGGWAGHGRHRCGCIAVCWWAVASLLLRRAGRLHGSAAAWWLAVASALVATALRGRFGGVGGVLGAGAERRDVQRSSRQAPPMYRSLMRAWSLTGAIATCALPGRASASFGVSRRSQVIRISTGENVHVPL